MILHTEHLTIGYGKKAVQSDLNLTAARGSLICLLGTNGCGKSTLLRTLSCLQPSLAGAVLIDGKNVETMSAAERALLFSLVLTDVVSVEALRVRDLVAMGRTPYTGWLGKLSPDDVSVVERAIADVNLAHKSECFLHELSDGEKQRAVIAKALAQDTPLVLLDEPTAHLDLPNRIEIMLLLRRLASETQKCFILSMHELELAVQVADCILLMSPQGVVTGVPEDLMLNGYFQACFGTQHFCFDERDGHFSVNHATKQIFVSVKGDERRAAWLVAALKRLGVQVVEHSEITIEATANEFLFLGKSYKTIAQVLEALKTKGDFC